MNPTTFESAATFLNLTGNGIMLHRMSIDSERRLPPSVLCVQIIANCCWFVFAFMRTDVYLCLTAASSDDAGLQSSFVKETSQTLPFIRMIF